MPADEYVGIFKAASRLVERYCSQNSWYKCTCSPSRTNLVVDQETMKPVYDFSNWSSSVNWSSSIRSFGFRIITPLEFNHLETRFILQLQRCSNHMFVEAVICMYQHGRALCIYDLVSDSSISEWPRASSRETAVGIGTFSGCKTMCSDRRPGWWFSVHVKPACQVSFRPTNVKSAVAASEHPPTMRRGYWQ